MTWYNSLAQLVNRHAAKIMLGFCFAYFVYVGTLSVLDHWGLRTQLSDLGHHEQAIWQITQGNFSMPQSDPVLGASRFAQHANVIFYLIAPFYALWPRAETLLLLGTAAVATGGWLLFLLARHVLKNNHVALLFGTALLINPMVQEANMYDFHAIVLAIPLLLAAILSFEKQRWPEYGLAIIALLTVKEDMIILVCFVGLYAVLRQHKEIGMVTILIALLYALILLLIVPPLSGVMVSELSRARFGKLSIMQPQSFLVEFMQPQAIQYILYVALQGGFLAAFAPAALLLALPNFLQNILASINFQIRLTEVYYSGIVIAALYIAVVFGYRKFRQDNPVGAKLLGALFGLQAITISLIASPTPYSMGKSWTDFGAYYDKAAMQRILAQVPADAAVSTQNNVAAHLARRNIVVKYPHNTDSVEYILLHVADPTSPSDHSDLFFHDSPSRKYFGITRWYNSAILKSVFAEPNFGIMAHENKWYLLKRGHSKGLNEAAHETARADLQSVIQ